MSSPSIVDLSVKYCPAQKEKSEIDSGFNINETQSDVSLIISTTDKVLNFDMGQS